MMGGGGAFSQAARWEAKWLTPGAGGLLLPADYESRTSSGGNPQAVQLRALSHGLTSGHGDYNAIAQDCPRCRTIGSDGDDGNWLTTESVLGGWLLIAYR